MIVYREENAKVKKKQANENDVNTHFIIVTGTTNAHQSARPCRLKEMDQI
jgi:hypothetical protein